MSSRFSDSQIDCLIANFSTSFSNLLLIIMSGHKHGKFYNVVPDISENVDPTPCDLIYGINALRE